jgi:hypothetical protein
LVILIPRISLGSVTFQLSGGVFEGTQVLLRDKESRTVREREGKQVVTRQREQDRQRERENQVSEETKRAGQSERGKVRSNEERQRKQIREGQTGVLKGQREQDREEQTV